MHNYVVMQSRGDIHFMIAVFMERSDATQYVENQDGGGFYTFEVVEIPYNDTWENLENLALQHKETDSAQTP